MNKYSAFGLNIWSEFTLHELKPKHSIIHDVTIVSGQVDFDFSKGLPLFQDTFFIKRKEEFLLYVKDVAIYEVSNGNKISIESLSDSPLNEFKVFLYGTCFNALLLQREIVCLHGAGILNDGKVNLFIGYSGRGKSTLTTYFIQNGYSFLADDVLPLKVHDENQVQVGTSVGTVKLWENDLTEFGLVEKSGAQIREEIPKFRYTFHNSLAEGYFPISKIFILNWNDDEVDFNIQKLSEIEAIFYLREHIYRPQFIVEPEEYSLMLKLIVLLAQQTEVLSINGKRNYENLSTLKDLL